VHLHGSTHPPRQEESVVRAEADDAEGAHADGVRASAMPPSTSLVCSELGCRQSKDGTAAAAAERSDMSAAALHGRILSPFVLAQSQLRYGRTSPRSRGWRSMGSFSLRWP